MSEPTRTNIYVRTRYQVHGSFVIRDVWVLLFLKKSSAAAADVAASAAATTAASATAPAAAAVGHTMPGSASLYARLVSLTLEAFVRVVDVFYVLPASQLGIRYNLETKNLQQYNLLYPTDRVSRSRRHH